MSDLVGLGPLRVRLNHSVDGGGVCGWEKGNAQGFRVRVSDGVSGFDCFLKCLNKKWYSYRFHFLGHVQVRTTSRFCSRT